MKDSVWSIVKKWIKENPHAWWALYLPVYAVLYLTVEHVVDGSGPYWSSWCPLDDMIPFLEYFVVAYCSWHFIMIAVGLYLMFTDGSAFRRYMKFIAVGFTVSTLICFLLPNGQDLRPETFAHQNLFTSVLTMIYQADTNTNVFPSVHVIGCLALCFTALDSVKLRKLRIPIVLWSILIICSTVFVKQHSILDIFGAVALGLPIWIWLEISKRRDKAREERKTAE